MVAGKPTPPASSYVVDQAQREREQLAAHPKVTYSVTGSTRSASLTYTNGSNGTEQRTVDLPWSASFEGTPGQHIYLSAQNQEDTGSVRVTISVNGREVKRSDSSGAYAIATANGTL